MVDTPSCGDDGEDLKTGDVQESIQSRTTPSSGSFWNNDKERNPLQQHIDDSSVGNGSNGRKSTNECMKHTSGECKQSIGYGPSMDGGATKLPSADRMHSIPSSNEHVKDIIYDDPKEGGILQRGPDHKASHDSNISTDCKVGNEKIALQPISTAASQSVNGKKQNHLQTNGTKDRATSISHGISVDDGTNDDLSRQYEMKGSFTYEEQLVDKRMIDNVHPTSNHLPDAEMNGSTPLLHKTGSTCQLHEVTSTQDTTDTTDTLDAKDIGVLQPSTRIHDAHDTLSSAKNEENQTSNALSDTSKGSNIQTATVKSTQDIAGSDQTHESDTSNHPSAPIPRNEFASRDLSAMEMKTIFGSECNADSEHYKVNKTEKRSIHHMYGRPIYKGTESFLGCTFCGKAEEGDIMIMCDGEGCTNEYHLQCLQPPLTEVPKGKFFCEECNPQGTVLERYFDSVEEQRSEFSSSSDFVEALLSATLNTEEVTNVSTKRESARSSRKRRRNESDTVNERERQNGKKTSKLTKDTRDYRHKKKRMNQTSEIQIITEIYNHALDDSIWSKKSKRKRVDAMGPDDLVGNCVRIFCTEDNSYHVGRILDWRGNRCPIVNNNTMQSRKDFCYGNGLLATSEFFVRFVQGRHAQHKTIHRWITLEEHRCAVTVCIVMAQKDKSRGLKGWKPARILARSALEMTPHTPERRSALATFFGDDKHVFLNLENEAVDFHSEAFEQQWRKAHPSTALKAQSSDLDLALAHIEIEEQERVHKWHLRPLNNYAHHRSLTIRDENALDPVEVIEKRNSRDDHGHHIPGPCPLIQRGLDRFWITDQISQSNEMEFSLDSVASYTCSRVEPKDLTKVMAHLNHKEEQH